MALPNIKRAVQAEKERLLRVHRRNLRTFRQQPWQEISGSFGDIGTFVPIFLALVASYPQYDGLISAPSTLIFSGLFNIITGVLFGIPLPVQPMKAIAAVAISDTSDWTPTRYASAGLFVAAVVGFFSATGLIQWFSTRVPIPIVKGIQVAAGISLMMSGFGKLYAQIFHHAPIQFLDNYILGLLITAVTLLLLLFCSTRPKLPFVLIVVSLSIISGLIALLVLAAKGLALSLPGLSIWRPESFVPKIDDFWYGAFNAGLGQIPLTTLNSVVAVVYLAEDLLPDAPHPSATSVGLSVAAMNLLGCWFKAMPVCHGSGGLAAQYRFGARSGASIIFLGLVKIVLGLFASQLVTAWSRNMPDPVIGILLILAGSSLASMGESLNAEGAKDLWRQDDPVSSVGTVRHFVQPNATLRTRRYIVMSATIGSILGTKNDGVGLIVGLVVHYAYKLQDWEERRIARRAEGRIRLELDGRDQ